MRFFRSNFWLVWRCTLLAGVLLWHPCFIPAALGTDASSQPPSASDPDVDSDGDGLTNAEENVIGTRWKNPATDQDTDGDGVIDSLDGWAGSASDTASNTEQAKLAPPRLPTPGYAAVVLTTIPNNQTILYINANGQAVTSKYENSQYNYYFWDKGAAQGAPLPPPSSSDWTGSSAGASFNTSLAGLSDTGVVIGYFSGNIPDGTSNMMGYTNWAWRWKSGMDSLQRLQEAEDPPANSNSYYAEFITRPTLISIASNGDETIYGWHSEWSSDPSPAVPNTTTLNYFCNQVLWTTPSQGSLSQGQASSAKDHADSFLWLGYDLGFPLSGGTASPTGTHENHFTVLLNSTGTSVESTTTLNEYNLEGQNPTVNGVSGTKYKYRYDINGQIPSTLPSLSTNSGMMGYPIFNLGMGQPIQPVKALIHGSGSSLSIDAEPLALNSHGDLLCTMDPAPPSQQIGQKPALWNANWLDYNRANPLPAIWVKKPDNTYQSIQLIHAGFVPGKSTCLNTRLQIAGGSKDPSYPTSQAPFLWQNYRYQPLHDFFPALDNYGKFAVKGINDQGVITALATQTQNPDGSPIPTASQTQQILSLLPVEMTWKSQDGYVNVEDNKKVTAVDANDSPTTRTWMQGKGSKIFPDRKTPTDQSPNRNRCILHVKSAPNFTLYLKSFDVDDATPDSVDNDPANKIDSNDGAGDDNKDTVWAKPGSFPSGSGQTKTVTMNAQGEADVIFETTVQPGDNFRVAAACKQEDLNSLQVASPNSTGFIEGDSDKQPAGFNGVVSPMLTVWRRLWCEFDSMGAPPSSGPDANFDEGTVYSVLSTDLIKVSPLSDDANRFEDGTINIDGAGSFQVLGNVKAVGYDLVTIQGSVSSDALSHHFTIYDDDDVGTLSRAPRVLPYQLSAGSLIYTTFADAYIEPIKVPSQYVQNDVPFERNLNTFDYYFDWLPKVSSHRDLSVAQDFWTAYCICAWQPDLGSDKDPNAEPATEGLTDYGPYPSLRANQSAIYIETIREDEGLPQTPRVTEQHTIVHEIGHQGGGSHADYGIMTEGAPINENQFKPITIGRFRNNTIYHQ